MRKPERMPLPRRSVTRADPVRPEASLTTVRFGVAGRRRDDPWRDRAPIRAEIFGPDRFEEHATSLADEQTVVRRSASVVSVLDRLKDNRDVVQRCYQEMVQEVARGIPITPGAEWLVDNYHVIEKHARSIVEDLPHSYFRELPKLGPGFLEGHPRIFGILWAYVAHTDSNFDPDLLARYVRAYERRKALTIGELWAVAITLRLVLIENARRLAEVIAVSAHDRRRADNVADQLLGLHGGPPRALAHILPQPERFVPSRPFAVQLLRRLREEELTEAQEWLARRVASRGLDLDTLVHEDHQQQASTTVTMRNIFVSLRLIADVNWEDWFESVALLEDELRTLPGYVALDFTTRNRYRSAIETLARGARQPEIDVTRAVIRRASHGQDDVERDIGYWLIAEGRDGFARSLGYRFSATEWFTAFAKRLGIGGYLVAITAATAMLLGLGMWAVYASATDNADPAGPLPPAAFVVLGLLASIPISDLALGIVNYRSAKMFQAKPLPALSLRDGVTDDLRTLVAIPTMLTSPAAIDELVDLLEVHYLANQGGELYFALVTDWADGPIERDERDDELLAYARRGVRALNTRHGNRFLLLHRRRLHNPAQGVWMGWERKRGKLEELGRLLRGAKDTTYLDEEIEGYLPGRIHYVITLDSDTRLPRESARRLVGKMAHPLNRPVYDERKGRVVRGHGILQPRVTPSLPDGECTSPFQRIYSTKRGLDPYAFAVSDVYQDLFGEGSFAGKGIYDIDIVERALRDRVPENSLLSHDLLEGNYSRSGLVTDVEVVEEFPTSYAVSASRVHRWARGDWQLLPWILRRRRGLSALHLWKMIDNLRRSLSPVFFVAAFVTGLALLPWQGAAVLTAVLAGTIVAQPLFFIVEALAHRRKGVTLRSQLHAIGADLTGGVALGVTNLVLLSHQAWMMLDAITRTLWRLLFSRKNLLEWTTAAQAQSAAKGTLTYYLSLMAGGVVAPVAALAVGVARGPGALAVAALPAALWLAAPVVALRTGRCDEPVEERATADDLRELRLVARRTWDFFVTFVTGTENHLPPDNFQEDPHPVVAHRTSPTNIGLYLLTCVAARDFGWLGTADLADRLAATMDTIERMEHYRGHLYNWYDTRTLTPLLPRYISSVDSGNLAGHLLTLANACDELAGDDPPPSPWALGVRDGIGLIRQSLQTVSPQLPTGPLATSLDELEARLGHEPDRRWVAQAATHIAEAADDLARRHGVAEPAIWAHGILAGLASHERDDSLTAAGGRTLRDRLRELAARARAASDAMDFTFLLDRRRALLSVGYQVAEEQLDESCYDLLASECRLGSFVGIAKGDLRTKHWFRLGRPVTAIGNGAALLSWSGSMFEYLMPLLVMRSPIGGLHDRTARLVVKRQIEYASGHGIPWGISESAYNARDVQHTYQYSPFGVPGLGLVRGLADNLVVAPYATGLAAMVDPGAAAENYSRLAAIGARGRYGFYEALDFTPTRVPEGARHALVRCYMAHHQGMTLVSLDNVLNDGVMRHRFHGEPIVQACELLMQERAPRDVPISKTVREEDAGARTVRAGSVPFERTYTGARAVAPMIHLLSNGSLTMSLTGTGTGQTTWRQVAITRWHPDRSGDELGEFIYLRDDATGQLWSPTALPQPSGLRDYAVTFAADKVTYRRSRGPVATELECHVSPESDATVRRLTIRNNGRFATQLTVTSYAELALAMARDDDAHPAFSKMFVHTEFLPDKGAVIATRRRRSDSDPQVWAGQVLRVERGAVGATTAETDRGRFIGRGRTLRNPRLGDPRETGATGYVLDPCIGLSQRVRISAGRHIRLQLWTLVAGSREELLHLMDRHTADFAYQRVAMLSWTENQVQMRHLGITSDEAAAFQELAGHVVYPTGQLRPHPSLLARDASPQSALWPLGISGDIPLVVVRIDDPDDVGTVRQLVTAHSFWRGHQFAVDLVVLNDKSSDYLQELHRSLESIAGAGADGSDPGRIHVLRTDQVAPECLRALLSSAAVVFLAGRGTLADQLARVAPPRYAIAPLALRSTRPRRALSAAGAGPARPQPSPGLGMPTDLRHQSGYGGFSPDGREYVVVLDPGVPTPAPWLNVVANETFGFHATAEGAGCTWWRNSRDNQLTPWRNDPTMAPLSEAFYVRDDDLGILFSPTAAPFGTGRHIARHGFGYTSYEHLRDGIHLDLTLFVAEHDAVKYARLRLTNRTDAPRRLTVTWYAEPVLGLHRAATASRLVTDRDPDTGALFVTNPWATQYADQVVFADMRGEQDCDTTDRVEFLGRLGTTVRPEAVVANRPLTGRVGAGHDPCLALRRTVTIPPGRSADITVLLGAATDVAGARDLVRRHRHTVPDEVLAGITTLWQDRLGAIQVSTPDSSFDLMMNGWLLYQTLACRMLARSGYYQTSGAYGFRDQLQDSLAVLLVDPAATRSHLLRAAGRQFVEGDVQHWWLPATGAGIRTRISDDVVWLGYAAARYVTVTGDVGVLLEPVPYLSGPVLTDGQHEHFFQPDSSEQVGCLYEHCRLALRRAFTLGRHGLPLMGTGDWNDGMNRVGQDGEGESVWLGWFLHATLTAFIPVAQRMGDHAFAAEAAAHQTKLLRSLEDAGWDGQWYRRGYFDDGTPLGSISRGECRIDSIAQSWAVISGAARPERAEMAMDQVVSRLLMERESVSRLFTPPFEVSQPDPGYIRSYPPGVRENGGQYTHGAIWTIFAFAALRREDLAGSLFWHVNPINHARTQELTDNYRVEPYVVAADIYSVAPHVGRGGWTWYTGSSGWLFRAGLEAVLGLKRNAGWLVVEPCLPPQWTHASVTYASNGTSWRIQFQAPEASPRVVASIEVDGVRVAGTDRFRLAEDGGSHQVLITLAHRPPVVAEDLAPDPRPTLPPKPVVPAKTTQTPRRHLPVRSASMWPTPDGRPPAIGPHDTA